MIDLHSHILPGIDDGPGDMDGSLAFARAAVASGTTTIAATPHFDAHHRVSIADRDTQLERLRAALAAAGIPLQVVPGAEIALEVYLELDPGEIAQIGLGGGPYLLLECPLSQAGGGFDRFLGTLLTRGVAMVLAHPERCPDFQRHPERLEALVRAGALAQVTSASLSGRFGRTVQDAALHMLADGLVHLLASDAHDAERRTPDLREGLEAAERELPGAHVLADWLTVKVPEAVLAGAQAPLRPGVLLERGRKRRRLFGR